MRAARQDHLWRAFSERPGLTTLLSDHGHAFALGVEGQRPQAGHLRLEANARDPPLSCGDEQGALRGIPHEYGMPVLLAQFGIVTRGGTSKRMVQERLWRRDGVALCAQGEAPGARDHGTRRHRTERQRAGLVAADDLRTPEGLDRWQ